MNTPSSAEFAQYRFVRDGKGNVVTLPCVGSDERILLVLDCERWGLARLHIFEEAAARNDKREAFEEEMRLLAGWNSPSVSRLYSWGRDGEELFFADAMRDGEPLPDYLGRAGKVPVGTSARWVSGFIEQFFRHEALPASMDRLTTLNFEVVRQRSGELDLVFSEFTGWTRPGARVREHRWEWNLVQVLCSLVGGVPVRTFHRDSLPRNFEELPSRLREVILATLAEEGRETLGDLRGVLRELSEGDAGNEPVSPPRMPMREWLRKELAEAFPGEEDRSLPDLTGEGGESYAIPTRIRGAASLLQVLPGVASLPREGWLNQHHDSTRRPGRGLIHQLQVNFIEDAGAVTLVGEEQAEGVDLATLLGQTGPVDRETALAFAGRLREALDSLERKTGACPVWWLPPGNVLLLTGTRSPVGSAGFFERKGCSAWTETPLKFRLHQTLPALLEGIDLPDRVRDLTRLPGKQFEDVRRSVVAMPLLWSLLTGASFSWRTRAEHPLVPRSLAERFEQYRLRLTEDPEEVDESFFASFACQEEGDSEPAPGREMDPGVAGSPVDSLPTEEAVALRLDETLFQGAFGLASPAKEVEPGVTDVIELSQAGGAEGSEVRERRGPWAFWLWTAVAAIIAASIVGFSLYGWSMKRNPYGEGAKVELTLPDFLLPVDGLKDLSREQLSAFLLSENSPQSLRLLPLVGRIDAEVLHREIEPWLRHLGAKGDPSAIRIMGLLAQAHGEPTDVVAGWYREGARKGDLESRFRYVALLWDPATERFSDPECEPFLSEAAAAGHPGAKELLAHFLAAAGDSSAAFEAMDASAAAGWVPAIYQAGLLIAAGTGCPPDPEKGVTLLRKAAELGEVRAMYDFGRCLDQGFGVAASHPEAVRWMRLAAGRGHGAALRWLLDRKISPSHT